MKIAPLSLLCGMAMLTIPGLAQVNQSDSQTLKDILAEVRSIHADVRLSETTQILLTELQLEQSTVNTALQHRDAVRSDLNQIQSRNKSIAAEIARMDDMDSDAVLDPVRKKQLADQAASMKGALASTKVRENQLASDLLDAEGQLRNEQNKLAEIQGQLDEQVKRLQPPASR